MRAAGLSAQGARVRAAGQGGAPAGADARFGVRGRGVGVVLGLGGRGFGGAGGGRYGELECAFSEPHFSSADHGAHHLGGTESFRRV